jgi:PAS domain S-box-containing protein
MSRDLVLAATATAALGIWVGGGRPEADDPRFLPAIAGVGALCGVAGAVAGRLATRRRGSLPLFSLRGGMALAVVSTAAAGWAVGLRQGGDGWAALLFGLLFTTAALGLVLLSSAGAGFDPTGRRSLDADGLAAAAAQTASEDDVRALVDSARVLMWLSAPDGRRTYVNKGWLEFTGRSLKDELGNGWTSGLHPDDARRHLERGEAAGGDGRAFEAEYRLRRFDGEYRWMLERGQPRMGPAGAAIGFVGSCIDITERKLREAALQEERAQLARKVEERTSQLTRANDELAKAARLKDDFLANVSHELRTPLTAILGLSEALLGEGHGPLTEKQGKALHTIEESGRHLLSLINEILDLAKIEAGKMTLEAKEGVSIDAICQGSLRFVKEAAQKKGVSVSFTMDGSIVTLKCDERRIKQVLVNLLGNALKFTPPGGAVGLEVVGDLSENVVRFTVWDTGIGIRKEDMSRLFQPFVQIDGSLTRPHGGTGLGLALSRRMVDLHGGKVLIGSELGKGSRFTVVLPAGVGVTLARSESARASADPLEAILPATPAPAEGEPPRESAKARRILLVEDHDDLASMLTDYLRGRGHQVLCARTGTDGIEMAVRERPDVILMDVQMPGLDGLEAIGRIRATPGFESTAIVALTALAMPGDRELCLAAGATEYVSKPLSLAKLSAWIDALGGSHD